MLSSAQALLRRDLWTKNDDGKPVYRRRFSQGRVIEHYITTADPTSQYPEALAGEAAWQIVEQFGIPTAYLHLVFAAHAAAQPSPWQGMFRLQGSDLIKTLGMDRRTDVPKPGEGPSKEERENGSYDLLFMAIAPDGSKAPP